VNYLVLTLKAELPHFSGHHKRQSKPLSLEAGEESAFAN